MLKEVKKISKELKGVIMTILHHIDNIKTVPVKRDYFKSLKAGIEKYSK